MLEKTKAEVIAYLYNNLSSAIVMPCYYFSHDDWKKNKKRIVDDVINQFFLASNSRIIVRSSCLDEDRIELSNAGKYLSVPDVRTSQEMVDAVERVLTSYKADGRQENPKDQILIQPMLEDVAFCGVAFTLDPNTGGNYYVINYDMSGGTDGITSGMGRSNRLFYKYKFLDEGYNPSEGEVFIPKLLDALKELEALFEKENLDVEFAVDSKGQLYIFQVRELVIKTSSVEKNMQTGIVEDICKKVASQQQKKPYLCGHRAIYSVMTDWNPAEMIGITPKPLALSLYKEIITDSVWAYQRDNYGYRNLRSFPLLVSFGGCPYIDVRVSFNSFVPAELDEKISEKLVDYYLDMLEERPEEHDKAEFNIVFSCYTFDLPERIKVLKGYGFSEEEIHKILESLRNVTNNIIDHENGLWRKDYEKIEKLSERYEEIVNSSLSDVEKVYWLLEYCKRYGTLPFAGLARAAFVGVQLLKSMVTCQIISLEDYEAFMNDVDTVSSKMNRDLKELSKDVFLKKYGHLRPGTYDITSPRYDEAPDKYFDWDAMKATGAPDEKNKFRLSMEQMHELRDQVKKNGFNNDILELLDFIKKVIEGREYGKFIFTKSLSKALQIIKEMGGDIGLDAEEMSYLDIHTIYEIYGSASDTNASVKQSIEKGKDAYKKALSLRLPPVIIAPGDVLHFYYPESEANYITSGRAIGEAVEINEVNETDTLEGKILLIQGADPGYDWIFSKRISGFITMYGGANSHMAIRAGELGIPAAVGVGEVVYNECCDALKIEINAAEKKIRVIRTGGEK